MSKVITISRQYGSGGRELGEKLAGKLGIPLYDKELINMIAREENIEISLLEAYDEEEPDLNSYTARDIAPDYQIDMAKKVFEAYSRVLRDLAAKGPCVIVVRCGDVVSDSVKVFVYAEPDAGVRRIREIRSREELSEDRAVKEIHRMDHRRQAYHKFYCGKEWGRMEDYDICLNTTKTGVDGALEAAAAYVEQLK